MKAVVDTNVLVSGLITPGGPCGRIIDLIEEGAIQPCVDARIMEEYEDVLRRPRFQIPAGQADELLQLMRHVGVMLAPLPISARLPDSDDLAFLETAAAAGAVLVTGNARHYPKGERAGVRVVTPSELLDSMRGE